MKWQKILDWITIVGGIIALFALAVFSWAGDIPTAIIERIHRQPGYEVASLRLQEDGKGIVWLSVLFYPPDTLVMTYVRLRGYEYVFGDEDIQEVLKIEGEKTTSIWKKPAVPPKAGHKEE